MFLRTTRSFMNLFYAAKERCNADFYEHVQRPHTPIDMAQTFIFDLMACGWANDRTRDVYDRVMLALNHQVPVRAAFNHQDKASTIQSIWNRRRWYFEQLAELVARLPFYRSIEVPWETSAADLQLVNWFRNSGVSYLQGPAVSRHVARDLGANVAKCDRWLKRIAWVSGETVDGLCERLSRLSGKRIATIDYVLWFAAQDKDEHMLEDFMTAEQRARYRRACVEI